MVSVLDASALLALLYDEPGANVVAETIAQGAAVSAVNLAETATVLTRGRRHPDPIVALLRTQVDVEPFTYADAVVVAALHPLVAARGPRACLALAGGLSAPAVMA